MKSVDIYDCTLREGAQSEGISLSVEDKLHLAQLLDRLGIAYIEAGNPASNPKDMEFFERAAHLQLKHAQITAFGSTCRKNIPAEEDEGLHALLHVGTQTVAVFGKSSVLHVEEILGTTQQENLRMIEDTCQFLTRHGRRVVFDAEHFFDAYALDSDYALQTLRAACRGGVSAVCLCDTNGGRMPEEIASVTRSVCDTLDVPIGIHCHNDSGMAVAATVMAVEAGAVQVQGTFLGLGERCGNANLATVIPNLQLKLGYSCIPQESLHLLSPAAREAAEICNTSVKRSEPYIGRSAFAHKAGMHIDGVMKNPQSYEHVPPESVGNERRILTSEVSGRAAVWRKVSAVVPRVKKDSPELDGIIQELKRLEAIGYQFEGAQASFELLIWRRLGEFHPSFELVSYKVLDELPYTSGHSATATLKIRVGDQLQISAAEGNGPVNALDKALREALEVFYPSLHDIRLVDYKVRVLEPQDATAAWVRVLITTADKNRTWTTVGLSENVIEASWQALVDSMEYKLNLGF